MDNKVFNPGETVEESGIYPVDGIELKLLWLTVFAMQALLVRRFSIWFHPHIHIQ